jgi:hypothetical protein
MKFPLTTKLAGVSHGDCQDNIKQFGCPDIGSYALIREPDNSYDPCAIRISLFDIWFMGYVPKQIAKDLAPLIDEGRTFLAMFVCRNEHPTEELIGLTVKIVETTYNLNQNLNRVNLN